MDDFIAHHEDRVWVLGMELEGFYNCCRHLGAGK